MEPSPSLDYVFGYASLVGLFEELEVEGIGRPPVPGRLRGYRRRWGAAMNNWEGGEQVKHFLDRETGERPRIRVAYLDIEPSEGGTVNGLAIPADPARLVALDAREVNYARVDVTEAFEPDARVSTADESSPVPGSLPAPPIEPGRVFAYVATAAARERCRAGAAAGDVFVSREYLGWVRQAFAALGDEALAEFERTTEPPPFPEADLQVVRPEGR